MWELTSAIAGNPEEVEAYLRDGYEPFAITQAAGYDRIWLKRKVEDAISGQSSKPKRRTSQRITVPKQK